MTDAKQAKELAPEQTAALKKWRSAICKRPSAKQLDRLRALSRRVERLWELTFRRLEISEREIARQIDVWRADTPAVSAAVTREAVESELLDPEGPYMRLRLAMDAWCAMWFWPPGNIEPEGDKEHETPPTLDVWIATMEGLLGAAGVKVGARDQGMFHETIESFDQLSVVDDLEREFFAMLPTWQLISKYPWLGAARSIGDQQGFFHWELDFAHIFSQGGFDLQVGNPPWVRPVWRDDVALAEFDPYIALNEKISERIFAERREIALAAIDRQERYLSDVTGWAGLAEHLGRESNIHVYAECRRISISTSWNKPGVIVRLQA